MTSCLQHWKLQTHGNLHVDIMFYAAYMNFCSSFSELNTEDYFLVFQKKKALKMDFKFSGAHNCVFRAKQHLQKFYVVLSIYLQWFLALPFLSIAPTPNTPHRNFCSVVDWMCTIHTHTINFLTPRVCSAQGREPGSCAMSWNCTCRFEHSFNTKRFQFAHLAPLHELWEQQKTSSPFSWLPAQ